MLGLLVLVIVLVGWCIRVLRRHSGMLNTIGREVLSGSPVNEQTLLDLMKDASELRGGITTLAHDLENLRTLVEQTHRYANNRADRVVTEAMGKLNGLYERIDALEGEVITQQMTRHRLNEMLAAGLKDKTND